MTGEPLVPIQLRCAHLEDPLAVEIDRIRFAWCLAGRGDGRLQTGFQVVVEDVGAATATWDSGRLRSDESADVAYGGDPLRAGSSYRWRVRAWDEAEEVGPWSGWARFETALGRDGWAASWIGLGRGADHHFDPPAGEGLVDPVMLAMRPAPYLRRAFTFEQAATRARLHVTALGVYELSLNGRTVGEQVLAPGWTDYTRRILYQTYDVTDLLTTGENVLAAVIADGWACGFFGFDGKHRGAHYADSPVLLAQLVIETAEGTTTTVASDSDWRSATGAIAYADLLMGERRDLRHEPSGWRLCGFDDSGWVPVRWRALGDERLLADPGPPIRVIERLPAAKVVVRSDGAALCDFGQNLAGWVEVAAALATGTEVEVRHGEALDSDGGLYVENLRTARQVDSYVAPGGDAVLAPRFTFHGFRYAEISGLGPEAGRAAISASVVHSDTPKTGAFECSSPELNRLYQNIDWGQRGNFLSIPTDCPQRDERLGWLGDAQVFVRTATYNRDVAAFFSKWMDDVVDAQAPGGAFPDFAPNMLGHGWSAPAWADAGVIVPWTIYKMYGDRTLLGRHWGAMASWVDWLSANNPSRLWTSELGNNFGDWLAPGRDDTPRELLATAYFAYDSRLMAEMARALGRDEEAGRYERLFAEIREAFQKAFLSDEGRVASGTQTAYALALHVDLVPEQLRPAAAAHLVEAIEEQDWHLSTGFVGVSYLLPVLSANGRSDVAYRLLEQRTYPSWLYPLAHGATTIWERWDGWTEPGGFQSPRMNSFNHYSLGSVGEWLYRFVLGIDQEPGSAGFRRLILRPHPGGSLSFARGSFQSVRGEISASWSAEEGRLTYQVALPPNVTASVRVPSSMPESVEGPAGRRPDRIDGYPGEIGAKEAVFEVTSGTHSFVAPA